MVIEINTGEDDPRGQLASEIVRLLMARCRGPGEAQSVLALVAFVLNDNFEVEGKTLEDFIEVFGQSIRQFAEHAEKREESLQ